MAKPPGKVAKLFWRKEGTEGTYSGVSLTTGLRLYFLPPFDIDAPNEPQNLPEVKGTNPFDHREMPLGAFNLRGRVSWGARYSGVHAVMDGWALGDLDTTPTTPSTPPYTHRAKTADAYAAASWTHQPPIGTPTEFDENRVIGCKVARLTYRHRAGESLITELEYVGNDLIFQEAVTASVPPDDNTGYNPAEPLVEWFHLTGNFVFDRSGAPAAVNLDVAEWEMTLDNDPEQIINIQSSRKQTVPARGGEREIRGRFTIDQDVPLRDVLNAYGYTLAEALEDFSLAFTYQDPAVATNQKTFQFSNCKAIRVGRGTPSDGAQQQEFEFRAHFKTGGAELNPEPLVVVTKNQTLGTAEGNYGTLI